MGMILCLVAIAQLEVKKTTLLFIEVLAFYTTSLCNHRQNNDLMLYSKLLAPKV